LDDLDAQGIAVMNTANLTTLRSNMLAGIKSPGCTKCYDQEGTDNASSLRTYINNRFPNIQQEHCTAQFDKLRYIEMSIDNICNLQCKMCDSKFSTKLINRDRFLGEEVHKKLEPNFRKYDNTDLSNLELVKVLGGEPFMTPNFVKFVDYLIDRADPSKITIEIATNGTLIPSQELVHKLNKFKTLDIYVSLDSYSKANDYQRYGSSYLEIFANTKLYSEIFDNAITSFHTVVSLLTANTLASTVNTLIVDNGYQMSVDFVRYPYSLSLLYAPAAYVDWILECNTDNQWAYTLITNFLKVNEYNAKHWQDFVYYTKQLDGFYNTRLEDYNPALHKFLTSIAN
jgi:organic radical activating enzyme